ncbi:MAG: VWA domain-containing protein [Bifidobacterium subtile]|jgi:Ca-activated chloride channel family protein|uniref:vWA domain-containing protein n=1 Tax=Bifidobacterium subtile TaxID=77635 RepID=UPI002F35D6F6|nr:VWA domain-containing protein [Bifidobacterium subtile]MCI1241344.1 VWA domain-containing protein [Bifidobacterium subtile]MCI1258083.1 VWA domain-containing protein [Bifidobacterium subtile]
MNGLTLSPALGWPLGAAIAVAMAVLAVLTAVMHVKHRSRSDETLAACIRRTVLCLLVAVMALTPSIAAPTALRAVNTTDVVLAVDVTGSMAVEDAGYESAGGISRIDAAKQAVDGIAAAYPNSSFAALRFGVSGTLDVPLTPDTLAIRSWADTLSVEPTSLSTGSRLDAPIDQLLLTAKSIRAEHPQDAIVLYLITDGEQTSTKARRTYSSLRQYFDDAFTVGVGSTQGGKIPQTGTTPGASHEQSQWVMDPSTGQPGISAMNEKNLKDIADELSGRSVILSQGQSIASHVSDKVSRRWRVSDDAKRRERVTPIVWPFAIAAAALLTWELGAWIVMSRRSL